MKTQITYLLEIRNLGSSSTWHEKYEQKVHRIRFGRKDICFDFSTDKKVLIAAKAVLAVWNDNLRPHEDYRELVGIVKQTTIIKEEKLL